ncbi:hypothetical protein PVAP13_5NG281500 [Panicum virgatum]|uniref:Glycosyltransferase n=1 Tax=Panicum virgatum TaxID=38727 RepID=A0A8T0S014_PANVG|nr:hypothetical protein PVAP13_5NG281500 [Panicum virgatum]
MEPAAHVVLLASPGAGHVLPMAELARRVVDGAEFTATLVTYTNFSSAGHHYSTLASLPPSVSTTVLPEVPLGDLPADARVETRIFAVVQRALPHLRDLLSSLLASSPAGVAAFVADILGAWALEVSTELGVPGYVFCPSNLTALQLHSLLYMPRLDEATACEFRDLPEPVRLPGCVPLRGADLVEPVQDRTNPEVPPRRRLRRQHLRRHGARDAIAAFTTLSHNGVYPPAYAVGPFVRTCSGSEAAERSCLRWLDEQPDGSVLYACFGSGGTLSSEQMAELAAGLEASGQRFLWMVRFPSDKDDRGASYLGGSQGHGDSPLSYLPEGFVERTRATGLAVTEWTPQVEVLNHRAVGGFLSHCGWNSTPETVAAGVPTLAWPLHAEQRMNAVMLSEQVGLALRLNGKGKDGVLVPREEVAAAVTELMVGEKASGPPRRRPGRRTDRRARRSRPSPASGRRLRPRELRHGAIPW